MIQYLVTTFKDSTGRKHTHITRAKSNQSFTVVEAESKEEAKEKYEAQV
ncbi:phage protein, partial [Staphylococcus aureus F87602]